MTAGQCQDGGMASTWQLPPALTEPGVLPPGRYVAPLRDGDHGAPVLWVTSNPVPDAGARWADLHARCAGSAVWPLVLLPLDGEPWAPWHDGELDPVGPSELAPEDVLAGLWRALTAPTPVDEELETAPGAWRDAVVELGLPPTWDGLAPAGTPSDGSADAHAAEVSAQVFHDGLLGVVPAGSGSAAIATIGWDGACNHTGAAELAVVVRSWEERFGVRLVGLGFDTMELSVAAPPATMEHARRVAAEHFAFCPDNIALGPEDFDLYARHLVGAGTWSFWWD
jgi:hypothetical protein